METPDDRSIDAPEIPRSQRTDWNVRDSDGTLLLFHGDLGEQGQGTRWTIECAKLRRKPFASADPSALADVSRIHHWIQSHSIETLNVAGPSESSCPGIGAVAERFVAVLLRLDALYR
jgi:hypothetical protein